MKDEVARSNADRDWILDPFIGELPEGCADYAAVAGKTFNHSIDCSVGAAASEEALAEGLRSLAFVHDALAVNGSVLDGVVIVDEARPDEFGGVGSFVTNLE